MYIKHNADHREASGAKSEVLDQRVRATCSGNPIVLFITGSFLTWLVQFNIFIDYDFRSASVKEGLRSLAKCGKVACVDACASAGILR